MIQRMLAIWSLVPLPFLKPAWTSGSSWFMYCWSLAWRILSEGIVATYCKLLGSYAAMFTLKVIVLIHCYWSRGVTGGVRKKGEAVELVLCVKTEKLDGADAFLSVVDTQGFLMKRKKSSNWKSVLRSMRKVTDNMLLAFLSIIHYIMRIVCWNTADKVSQLRL